MNTEQLGIRLEALRIDPSAYSLSGGLPNERLVLNQEAGGRWEVSAAESGLRIFDTESSATQFFLDPSLTTRPSDANEVLYKLFPRGS